MTRSRVGWWRARGVRRREGRVVHLTVRLDAVPLLPPEERLDDVLTDATFSARDETGGHGARSGDYW